MRMYTFLCIRSPKIWLFPRFFVTLRLQNAKLLRLGKKRNEFLCYALDFS